MVEIKPTSGGPSRSLTTEDHEGNRFRLLYSKSKVYVNPTVYARDNIPGFVALVKRVGAFHASIILSNERKQEAVNPTYFLAWLPESLLNEKGQTEWDKFIKTEERMALYEEEEGTLHRWNDSNVQPNCIAQMLSLLICRFLAQRLTLSLSR